MAPIDVAYLQTLPAVREQSRVVYDYVLRGDSAHWTLDLDNLPRATEAVLSLAKRDYAGANGQVNVALIPPHARWRHFSAKRMDKLLSNRDKDEQCRMLIDLFVVSVLLDAGAGAEWRWTDPYDGTIYSRSEGLAMASLDMFTKGTFSKKGTEQKVEVEGLLRLSLNDLKRGLQVEEGNQVVGLENRLELLRRLGRVIQTEIAVFEHGGLSDCLDVFTQAEIDMQDLWSKLIIGVFGQIWPSGSIRDELKDVWLHRSTGTIVPFHKLSQWLTYSLTEPLEKLGGKTITNQHLLTGLAEYRNGGLFIDYGIIKARDKRVFEQKHNVDDEVIVEWRALTVVLLDLLAADLQISLPGISLAKVFEAGTWKAGREIAEKLRPDTGSPPLSIVSTGTVF